ncbi:MAG: hypothetical protein KatS3mg056_3971 [Chloroflexus sp.]|jgi:hypothetical protein|nr:MAG: hypothetical protein KatS3mg056_3971 [Chloroflexus sp.]
MLFHCDLSMTQVVDIYQERGKNDEQSLSRDLSTVTEIGFRSYFDICVNRV